MTLDVLKYSGVFERRRLPVEFPHPGVEGGVTGADVADVAFEVLDVDGLCGWSVVFMDG